MTLEEHTLELGKLIVTLHSLEFALRAFLCEANREALLIPSVGQTSVVLTHLTNYDFLGQLIKKYNDMLAPADAKFLVDDSVVELRDVLAHGRVMGQTPNPPLRIFKFNRPHGGLVDVVYDQVMDQQWHARSRGLVYDQVQKIRDRAQQLGFNSFP